MRSIIHETRIDTFRWYHLSKQDNLTQLEPDIPDNFMTKNGYEDNTTKRISFAPSINQCLMGLSRNLSGEEFFVYILRDVDKNKLQYPDKNKIPDVGITSEAWVTVSVRVQKFGKIRVLNAGTEKHEYKYGNNQTAALYDWDYRVIVNENGVVKEFAPSTYKNIIFDLGGVLIQNRVDASEFMSKYKLSEDELKSYLTIYYETVYKYQELSYSDALNKYIDALSEYDLDYELIKAIFNFAVGSKQLYDYTIPLLKKLKKDGYKLYYLSNWTKSSYEYCKYIKLFDFLNYFDGGLFSFQEGLLKPNHKFYLRLMNKYKLDVDECILLDDQQANIDAAGIIGLKAVKFTPDMVNIMMKDNALFNEVADYSRKNHYPVFIVLYHSGTLLSTIVKFATGDEYTHSCISFSPDLKPLYSFGNHKPGLINAEPGFVIQNDGPDDNFYKHYTAKYAVYVMYVSKAAYEAMQTSLNLFIDKEKDWKFDLPNLVSVFFNKESEKSEKYFCSKFVAHIINAGYKLSKVPSLYKPEDFKYLDNITCIDKGIDFKLYNVKRAMKNLALVKKQDFDSIKLEAFDIGLDYGNIYPEEDIKIYDPANKQTIHTMELELPDMEAYKPDIASLFDNTPLDHIYLTSDWHFFKNHYKHEANYVNTQEILKWCRQNIKPDDVFVYLGDLSFRYANREDQQKSQEFMASIGGHKIFVLGNHDKMLGQEYFTKCGFDYVLEDFTWDKYVFTHRPINMSTYPDDWWNIHGHIHNLRMYNTTDGKRNINVYPYFYDNKPVTLQYLLDHKEELSKDNEWNFNTGYGESYVNYHNLKSSNKNMALKAILEQGQNPKPIVYYSPYVDSKTIAYMVSLFKDHLGDRIAIKLHFGEKGNQNFLNPKLLKDLVGSTNAALIDSNTAYDGSSRGTTEDHIRTAKENGFTFGYIDILDADGDMTISVPKYHMIQHELYELANGKAGYASPVVPGRHLSEVNIGAHLKNYDSMIVYTHFKGHSIAGYGGSLKNIGMGIPSGRVGKKQIHGEDWIRGPLFLERLVESASAIEAMFDDKIIYVNILQNMSSKCDCEKDAPKATIPDIGVLVSTDLVAIEQASLDFVRNAPKNKELMEQIAKVGGYHQIEYMKWLGMGSGNYILKTLDDKRIRLESNILNESLFRKKNKQNHTKKADDYENPMGRVVVQYNDIDTNEDEILEILSGDAMDIEVKHSLENIDIEKQKLLLESKNLVQDYIDFVKFNIDKNFDSNNSNASYSTFFKYQRYYFNDNAITKDQIINFYNIPDDPEMIRQILQARINYIQGINAILKEMVKNNGKVLGLSSAEIEELLKGLSNDKTSGRSIAEIKDLIVKNADKFVKMGGKCLDLRPIGGGVYIGNDDTDMDMIITNADDIKNIIQLLFTYDLYVNSHGGRALSKKEVSAATDEINNIIDMTRQQIFADLREYVDEEVRDNKLQKLANILTYSFVVLTERYTSPQYNMEFAQTAATGLKGINDDFSYKDKYYINTFIQKSFTVYKKLFRRYKSFSSKYKLIVKNNSLIIDFEKSPMFKNKWGFEVYYLDYKKYTNIKEFLKRAKADGFDKIRIASCNPARDTLPYNLTRNVTFGSYSNYKEDFSFLLNNNDIILDESTKEIYKESLDALDDLERSYISIAEEYSINYNDNTIALNELYYSITSEDVFTIAINEAISFGEIIRKLIELIKRAIEFIIRMVKAFIDAIRRAIDYIHHMLSMRNQGTAASNSEIKLNFVTVRYTNPTIDQFSVRSQKELESSYNKAITSIVAEMKKNSDLQLKLENQLKRQCEDMARRGPDTISEAAFTIYKDDFKAEKQLYLSNFNKIKVDAKYIKDHPEIANELKRNDINYKSDIAYVWENKNNNIIAKLYIDNKDYKDGKKWIALIEITNGYRGTGLGKQVLEYAINVEKCTAIGVHKDNIVALNLYKQYGFKFYPKAEQDVKNGKNKYYLMYRGKLENPDLQASGGSNNISESYYVNIYENYFTNMDDIYYNKKKFDRGEINVCFITGQSGSGKSTMGRSYTKKAVVVELDDIIWNKAYFTLEDLEFKYSKLVSDFFTDPKYAKYFVTVEELNNSKFDNYESDLTNDFIDYTIKYAAKHRDVKFVLEGVWIYEFVDPKKIQDYAVYIKGTSMVVSLFRACKRDKKAEFLKPGMWLKGEGKLKNFRRYFLGLMMKQESTLLETKRSELPDSVFGIPEQRKFPLDSAKHVRSAIHLFGHAQEDKKKALAKRIKAAAKKYNISIPETTQCYKYLSEGAISSIIPDTVDTIVFDMGSVLVDANTLKALQQNRDIPKEYCDEILDLIRKELFYTDDMVNVQQMSVPEAKKYLSERAPEHIKPYIDAIFDTFYPAMFWYPYVSDMLKMFRDAGYKLYYLSNWTRFSYELEKNFFDLLTEKFDGGLFSFELGPIMKPQQEIYIAFLNRYSLDPHRCIFFDDRQENVDAAKLIGMNAYRFDKDNTPNVLFGTEIEIPDNTDDTLIITDGDEGFKTININDLTWWYICENAYPSNVDEECYYKTLDDAIRFKLERLISTGVFENDLEITEYVFTNAKAFAEVKLPPELSSVGIITLTESGAYEWQIQYPLELRGDILKPVKEMSLVAVNPIIGVNKPFLIKVGDSRHPELLPTDHYVYSNDISLDKYLSIDDNNKLKINEGFNNLKILEVYEFVGDRSYLDRLNRMYKNEETVYSIYTALTDRQLLTEDQIDFDDNFKKIDFDLLEQKMLSEMVTLKDNIMRSIGNTGFNVPFIESAISKKPSFLSKYNIDGLDPIIIKEDFDGMYFLNQANNKRSISVASVNMLTENMIKAIL